MSDNSQQPTNNPTQDGTVDDTAMENEENSNPSDNLTSQDGENQDGNFTQLELNSESDTTQSYEITSVKEKLKEAYYEIGRAAENAGDKYVVDREVIDAIRFYKEALTNYENGNSQLSKNGAVINEPLEKTKDALEPKLNFEQDDSKGYASVLNYNLPSSTSVSIRNYAPLSLPDDWFDPVNAFHYSGSDQFIEIINEVDPKKASIPHLADSTPARIIENNESSKVFNVNDTDSSSSKVFAVTQDDDFESQIQQDRIKALENKQQLDQDQDSMKDKRKIVKTNHSEIKEEIYEILKYIEKMDEIFHSNQFNQYMKQIARLTGNYQSYDPESIISAENDFLENPQKMKKILNISNKVLYFVDELIEKLKTELDPEAKKARDQELVDEVTRYEKAVLDAESNYKKETKERYIAYQNEIKGPADAYKQKLEELKVQLKENTEKYKSKKEEYERNQIKKASYDDFTNRIIEINTFRKNLANERNAKSQNNAWYRSEIVQYRHKFVGKNLNLTGDAKYHDYNRFIREYDTVIKSLQSKIKRYNKLIQNTTNERSKLWFKSWSKKYDQLTKDINNYKHYKSLRTKELAAIRKHRKNAISQQTKFNRVKSDLKSRNNEVQQKIDDLTNSINESLTHLKEDYPEIEKLSEPELNEQFKTQYNQLKPLENTLKSLKSEIDILKTSLTASYDSIYDNYNNQIKEFKTRYTNEQKSKDEQYELNKEQLEIEYRDNCQAIKEKYLDQYPEQTQAIIRELTGFQDNIENKIANIKDIGARSLETIDEIYTIAERYHYDVFFTAKKDVKNSKKLFKDLSDNRKKIKGKRIYSLVFENSIETGDEETSSLGHPDESYTFEEDLIPKFDLNSEIEEEDPSEYLFQEDTAIVSYNGMPDSWKVYAINKLDQLVNDEKPLEKGFGTFLQNVSSELNTYSKEKENNIADSYQVNANIFKKIRDYTEALRKSSRGRKNDSSPRYMKLLDNKKNKSTTSSKIFTVTIDPETNETSEGWPDQTKINEFAKRGYTPKVFQNLDGEYEVRFVKMQEEIDPKIFVIYEYSISSFLGDYGAGKTIKTFSLLPGESTTITMKTWKTSSETKESASSILESNDSNSTSQFQNELSKESEQSKEQESIVDKHANTKIGASASISGKIYGVGDAEAKVATNLEAGIKTNSKQNQKNTAKALSKAVSNHANQQSAKRETNVSESSSATNEQGEEEGIVRELKNINQSRTLNFVFRQLNQEFITVIHVTDIKIAFSTGFSQDYEEIPIYSLDSFVCKYFRDGYDLTDPGELGTGNRKTVREKVKSYLLNALQYVYDYKNRVFDVLDPVTIPGEIPVKFTGGYSFKNLSYKRFCEDNIEKLKSADPEIEEKYQDVIKGHVDHGVDGIVVDISRHIMRTDAIVVEALLGSGMALDDYAIASQIEAVREKQLNNAKMQLALDIIKMADSNPDGARLKADIYYKLFGLTPMKKPFEKSVVGIVPELKDTFENLKVD